MSTRIYVPKDWTYYFSKRGYNPKDTEIYHDFYMEIKRLNFNTDSAAGFSTLEMSWDAINKEMRSYLTGQDNVLWVNNINKLYNQYKFHFHFAIQKENVWNLESWRADVPCLAVVAAKCNP